MNPRRPTALACLVFAASTPVLCPAQMAASSALLAQAPQARALAGNCANCHGTLGHSQGAIPSLGGLPAPYFIEQMQRFREGTRPATVMHQLAKGYSDEEIAVLAAFFAHQAPAR